MICLHNAIYAYTYTYVFTVFYIGLENEDGGDDEDDHNLTSILALAFKYQMNNHSPKAIDRR